MALIQSFWDGKLSPIEKLCIKSFVDHGHEVHVYTFDPISGLPKGATRKDAGEILHKSKFFTYRDGPGAGSPSAFANVFRYALLAAKGEWWVDLDVLCLSSDLPTDPLWFAREDNSYYNVAVLRSVPLHPLILACAQTATDMGKDIAWGNTGPRLFTRLADQMSYGTYAAPRNTAYAVRWQDAMMFFDGSMGKDVSAASQSSLFVHLWQEIIRRNGRDKGEVPMAGSFLRSFVYRHPVSGWKTKMGRPIRVSEIRLASFLHSGFGISIWP